MIVALAVLSPAACGGGAGHVRGNLLNRRRHRSLGGDDAAFSTWKVEKAGRSALQTAYPQDHMHEFLHLMYC